MIGRADIEGSKSDVAMNAWPPQASYPCGNFSDTSRFKSRIVKGSIGHAFAFSTRTGNQNQTSFYPFALREISVLTELIFGHLRCLVEALSVRNRYQRKASDEARLSAAERSETSERFASYDAKRAGDETFFYFFCVFFRKSAIASERVVRFLFCLRERLGELLSFPLISCACETSDAIRR